MGKEWERSSNIQELVIFKFKIGVEWKFLEFRVFKIKV